MVITITAIITGISTVITYFAAQKWVFPVIGKSYKYLVERKNSKNNESLDIESKLLNIDKENSNLYSSQINFFVSQIDGMQKQMTRRSDEISIMSLQCDELRAELLILKKQLFTLKTKNTELKISYCGNENCINRIKHKN